MNEIGLVDIAFNAPLAFDAYETCKGTGSFIVIDRLTNATIGAGMIVETIVEAAAVTAHGVDRKQRERRLGQRGQSIWLSEDKRDLAKQLEANLFSLGYLPYVIDDAELIEHIGPVTRALNDAGILVLIIGSIERHASLVDHHPLPASINEVAAALTWLSDREALLL